MLPHLPGGVWFCDLVEAKSLEGLLATVVRALSLEVNLQDTAVLTQELGQTITSRGRVLLIFDNAEHVKFELVELLDEWERAAPNATFMVTSRVPLNRPTEDTWRVGPLSIDEARALFIDRSVKPIGPDEPKLDELLEQLDGMALAIELAARRTSLFRPKEMLERLDQRFRLLRESKRSARTDRHAALTVVLDSTWEALTPWEQDVLAQCAVFRGGFRLEDAEYILDLSAYPQAPWVVDALQNLVDKSLIATQSDRGGQRLNLLVSVWAYASQKLSKFTPENVRSLAKRHASRYAKYGSSSYIDSLIQQGGETLRMRLMDEVENLVVATQRSIAAKWVEEAVNAGMATLLIWDSQTSDQTARELTRNLLKLKLNDRDRLRVLIEHARLTKMQAHCKAKSSFRNAVDLSAE